MRILKHILIAAVCLAASLALFSSVASAGRFSTSNRNVRITFRELVFGTASGVNDTCALTLEGSFHNSTSAKVAGSLIGYVTRVDTASCTSNTTILRTNLPWHLTYTSFAGTLPDITSVRLSMRNAEFQVEVFGFKCLTGGSSTTFTIMRNTATGAISGLEVNETLPLRSGGGFGCPDTAGTITGTGNLGGLGTSTPITVTLI